MSESKREARGARGGTADAGRGIGGASFDKAIDLAVRGMLDVEPQADLRARVLSRIDALSTNSVASAFRRKIVWGAVPLAAAAVIILALVLPSRSPQPAVNPVTTVAATQPQPAAIPAPSTNAQVTPPTVVARSVTRTPRTRPGVRAAVADNMIADIVWMDPLAPPPAMSVPAIEPGRGDNIQSIDPASAQIPALEVRPISDTPRERRNQE